MKVNRRETRRKIAEAEDRGGGKSEGSSNLSFVYLIWSTLVFLAAAEDRYSTSRAYKTTELYYREG